METKLATKRTVHLTYANGSVESVPVVEIQGQTIFGDAFYGVPNARSFGVQKDILECIQEGATFGTLEDEGAEYSWEMTAR